MLTFTWLIMPSSLLIEIPVFIFSHHLGQDPSQVSEREDKLRVLRGKDIFHDAQSSTCHLQSLSKLSLVVQVTSRKIFILRSRLYSPFRYQRIIDSAALSER